MLEERENQRTSAQKKMTKEYNRSYGLKWAELSKFLKDDEYNALMAEAEDYKYDPSDNGEVDALTNFNECYIRHLKKQIKGRKNPLENNKPQSGIGTVTQQKIPEKETALPKLDAAAQSYLQFVTNEDGAERATDLHKAMAK